jgi:hypothetical protein
MPRGVKGSGKQSKSVGEQIAELDAKIEEYSNKIAEAKAQKKTLLKQKTKVDYDQLLKTIKKSGLSVGEVAELVNDKKK